MSEKKSMGFMYLAKRPCGRVSASRWDDKGAERDTAAFVARCIKRGDTVERLERFEGDPMPEWICKSQCRECKQ